MSPSSTLGALPQGAAGRRTAFFSSHITRGCHAEEKVVSHLNVLRSSAASRHTAQERSQKGNGFK